MNELENSDKGCGECQHFLPWFISARGETSYGVSDLGQCFKKRFFHTLYLTDGTSHEVVKVSDGLTCSEFQKLEGPSEHYGTL